MSRNGIGNKIERINLSVILPNKDQPRKFFDDESLNLLADSFDLEGDVDYAILVTPVGNRYKIIDGERRYRAAKLSGLEKISCQIHKKMTDEDVFLMSARANLCREEMSSMEMATTIKKLMDDQNLNQNGVARLIGKSPIYVSNILKYLNLHPMLEKFLRNGDIGRGVALKLTSYNQDDQMAFFYEFRLVLLKKKKGERTIHPNEIQRIFAKFAEDNNIIPRVKGRKRKDKKSNQKTVYDILLRRSEALLNILKELDETSVDSLETATDVSASDNDILLEELKKIQLKLSTIIKEMEMFT